MSITLNEADVTGLISFLDERRRLVDEILKNEHFLNLAHRMHLDEDSMGRAAEHFFWVSDFALPEPAVRKWIHGTHVIK